MKNLTLKNIVSACGGDYHGDPALLEREISTVETDSRKAVAGCLFAAIAGDNSNGHDFINSSYENGALCALAQEIPEGCKSPVIVVRDTVAALGEIAEFYRSGFNIPIIGITGSVGKTTMKEMVYCVVSQRFCTHKTEGNFNNNLGVPLTLFQLNDKHEAAVIEMGISHFGEMAQLGRMVRPQYAVFSTIGSAHLEFLGDFDGVLKAKTEMLEFMPEDAEVFINGDDLTLRKLTSDKKIISFGLSESCSVSAQNVQSLGADGIELTIVAEGRSFNAKINSFGLQLVTAALGAAAVGLALGLTDAEITAGIAAYAPVGGRSSLEKTSRIYIVNDCYNANPTSTGAALKSLVSLPGRHVAILGDMLELGDTESELHYETGVAAAIEGVDLLLTTGALSEMTYEGAMETGLPDAQYYGTKEELIAALPALIQTGDAVLVKASHSRKFEDIVAVLRGL